MSRTQLRLGQVTGSFGSDTGQINQAETKSTLSAMSVNDLSDVLGHMASAIKRIHGAGDFSNQDAGNFSLALTGSAGMKLAGDLDVDSSADIAGAVNMQAGLTVAGAAALNGNVDLGDAVTDSISFVGRADSDLLPIADSTHDLGSSSLQWAELHVDVGHIDQLGSALDANSQAITNVNIDSGNIDGATIATSDITVGGGKTLDVSAGTLTLADNQISGDKVEGGTIAAISITTLSGQDATFTGNLTVEGTTTTLDTANLLVEDAIILLGSGSGGESAAGDRGLVMAIGSATNPAMFWDNSADQFAFVRTTADGSSSSVSADAYADLRVQELTASNGLNAAGQSLLASVAVGDLTSGRVVFAGTGGELVDDAGLTYIGGEDKLIVAGDVQGSAISGSASSAFQLNGVSHQQILKTTAGNFGLKTSGPNAQLGFADSHFTGSSHSSAQLPLATDVSEYNTFVTNFGNVSIIDAINQARSGTPNAGRYNAMASAGSTPSAGTEFRVTGFDRSALSLVQLVERVDVFVNGQLLLTGSSAGATARDYHFTGVANDDGIKFTFDLEVDDTVSVIVR